MKMPGLRVNGWEITFFPESEDTGPEYALFISEERDSRFSCEREKLGELMIAIISVEALWDRV